MAFWKGVKQVFSGIEEIAATPAELLAEMKYKRRIALSGKYTIHILPEYGYPALVAHITFNGNINTHDIDLLTYNNGTADAWDELPDSTKVHVNSRINSFLYALMDKNRTNPYH